jgi:hypothetical protein
MLIILLAHIVSSISPNTAYVARLTDTVLEFGKIVKKGIEKQNMLAWQYNAVGVSDAITMGGEGNQIRSPNIHIYIILANNCAVEECGTLFSLVI